MRKTILLLFTITLLIGCSSDDDDSGKQTFFVNVFSQYSQEDKAEIASPALVYLFKDNGKTLDKDKSYISIFNSSKITYSDGTVEAYNYKSSSESGINTFEEIPNGKYIIFVMYLSYNRLRYGASHKHIDVNYDYRATTEKKVFLYRGISSSDNYGYQDWDESW